MEKIKIGYYTAAEDCGGADIYLRDLIEHLDTDQYEIVLFCRWNYPALEKIFSRPFLFTVECIDRPAMTEMTNPLGALRQHGTLPNHRATPTSIFHQLWHRLPVKHLKLCLGFLKETRHMIRLFRKHNLQILHCNDAGSEPAAFAAWLLRIPRVIITFHWLATHEGNWLRRLIENLSMRCFHIGIAVSKATREAWIKRTGFSQNRLHVIYNGIDLKKFSTTSVCDISVLKQSLGLSDDDLVVGVTARLRPAKGHKYLLQALPQVIAAIPKVKVLLVGDGVAKAELQKIAAELHVDRHVIFAGFRSDVQGVTMIYDIAVLPSIALESFGLALAEAMALAKPVVATNFSGIPEVVEDGITGFLVPPANPEDLAEAIIKLLSDKEQARAMGLAGQRRVQRLFTQEEMLSQTFQMYQKDPHQKIRIGFCTDATGVGGADAVLSQIMEHMDRGQYEVFLFCRHNYEIDKFFRKPYCFQIVHTDQPSPHSRTRSSEVSVSTDTSSFAGRLKFYRNKSVLMPFLRLVGFLRQANCLKAILKKYQLDIFHYSDVIREAGILAARLARIPVIIGTYQICPPEPETGKTKILFWVERFLEKLTNRCLDKAIIVSRATLEQWAKRLAVPESKFELIYNGIELSPFAAAQGQPPIRRQYNIRPEDFVIGVSARLEQGKGLRYLIEAAPRIIQVFPNAKIIFAGTGQQKGELEELSRQWRVQDHIYFLGWVKEIKNLMRTFDIAVLPSVAYEALPLSLMIAMDAAKPVVATDFSGIPEIVEDGVSGILVARFDSQALAEAIIRLLTNKEERVKMGEAGRRRVEQLFSQEQMLQKTFLLYDRLLTQARWRYKIVVAASKLEHVKRGVETWARDTAYALRDRGIKVTLYKGSGPNHRPFEKALASIKEGSPLSRRLARFLPKSLWHIGWGFPEQIEETTFALSIIIKSFKEKFDLIHTQDAHVAQALQFARRLGLIRSTVILGHGTEEPFEFLKKFDYVQHLAPHHLQEALEHCGRHPGWFAIPNFVDCERFKPAKNLQLRQDLNIPQNAFVVLSVAAIKRAHKRIDYLMREVAALISTGSQNVYLVVAGGQTPQTEEMMALGKNLLRDHIRFLVNQSHDQMPGIYNLADIFVLCSLKEMMPIALLEALASGLPCLGNTYPVIQWMIADGGESITMSKDGELTETIKRYLDYDYRLQKSDLAKKRATSKFAKEVVINQIVEMYKKVLNE